MYVVCRLPLSGTGLIRPRNSEYLYPFPAHKYGKSAQLMEAATSVLLSICFLLGNRRGKRQCKFHPTPFLLENIGETEVNPELLCKRTPTPLPTISARLPCPWSYCSLRPGLCFWTQDFPLCSFWDCKEQDVITLIPRFATITCTPCGQG